MRAYFPFLFGDIPFLVIPKESTIDAINEEVLKASVLYSTSGHKLYGGTPIPSDPSVLIDTDLSRSDSLVYDREVEVEGVADTVAAEIIAQTQEIRMDTRQHQLEAAKCPFDHGAAVPAQTLHNTDGVIDESVEERDSVEYYLQLADQVDEWLAQDE